MRLLIAIAAWLYLAITCLAATPIYVDPARADDTGSGATPALAKKTIAAAYAAVDAGGSVYLLAGTYDDTTQGATWQVTFSSAKSVTIKPDPATSPTITLAPSNATRQVYFSQAGATYTHRLEGVTVTALANSRPLESTGTCAGTIQVVDCTFTSGNKASYFPPSGARTILIDGCTITTSDYAFNLGSAALVTIRDCTFASTNAVGVLYFAGGTFTNALVEDNDATVGSPLVKVAAASAFGNLSIRRNSIDLTPLGNTGAVIIPDNVAIGQFTAENNEVNVALSEFSVYGIKLGDPADPAVATNYGARVIGNVIATADTNIGYGVYVGNGFADTVVQYNQITGWNFAVFVLADRAVIDSNYINALNPVVIYGGTRYRVLHNHLVSVNNGSSGRCLVSGRIVKAASTATTTYAATTVTDAGGTPWGAKQALVSANMVAMVGPALQPTHWGIVSSITGDEITVAGWHKYDAAGTVETPTNGVVCNICMFPRNWVITDNLMNASACDYTITYDYDPVDPQGYQDRNVYSVGLITMSNLGINLGDSPTTLTTLQERWAALSPTNPTNDANSTVEAVVPSRYNTFVRWWQMPNWRPHGYHRGMLIPF